MPLQELDRSRVHAHEIDSLGHLNVRFYLSRVDRAARALCARVGLDAGLAVRRVDTYSQFKREQFKDAELTVLGGLLGTRADQLRGYFEIRNPDRDELAGVFVTGSQVIDPATGQPHPIPAQLAHANEQHGVVLPDYARPRSLSLEPPRTDVALAALEARIPDDPATGMMGGRFVGEILVEDCGADGFLRDDIDPMFVMQRAAMQRAADAVPFGPPVLHTDDGRRFSWAMMETRSVTLGRPRAGDTLVWLGADVAFAEKSRQSRRWAFVESTGELISIHDTVGVAIDLDARRSIAIPASMRAAIERNCLPEYR